VLGSALANAGHQVSVLYIHLPGALAPLVDGIDGCRVFHATIGNWHYYFHRTTMGQTSLPRVVRAWEEAVALTRGVEEINRKERLDIIELPEVFVLPRGLCGVPYIMRLHSAAWTWRRMLNEPTGIADSLEIRIEKQMLGRARGISSPCVFLANYIRQTCDIHTPVEIVPYPVDTTRFAPGEQKDNPPTILFVGRVEKRKGADVLMQAMPRVWAQHPACEFVFAGRIENDCKDQVAAMPPQVKFLGILPHTELATWYRRAAIFAAPSLWDNSPNTIYEAMACGTPVIATRVGGIPELVDEGVTGLLVSPSDPDELAEAIIMLLDNCQKRERMGQRARAKAVEQYSLQKILVRTLGFYENVLGGKISENA
jgi:glycosyltransferase involved in cell wall biosynthesis